MTPRNSADALEKGNEMMRPLEVLRFASATAIAVSLAATAHAQAAQGAVPAETGASASGSQQAPGESTATTGDIVVTAQFREQRLQDTPIAITAVNSALLEARSQTNIAQVANQAPNVIVRPQGASFGPSVVASIRGIGQGDFNPAFEPGVGIYIDDVYYPQLTGALFDLLDLDRVEVLRGPQGTLAGRNSIGGAIKLYSKKPNGQGGGYLEATYGIRNRIDFRGSVDLKLADDLFARIAAVSKQQKGYVDNIDYGCSHPGSGVPSGRAVGDCVVSRQGGVGYTALRGTVRYAPSTDFEINVSGDYTKDDRTPAGEVLTTVTPINDPDSNAAPGVPFDAKYICGKYCNYGTTSTRAEAWQKPPFAGYPIQSVQGSTRSLYDGYGFAGQVHLGLADRLSLESITSYRHFNSRFSNDDDLSPSDINFGVSHLTHHSFSQELRLNGKVLDSIDFTLGGYYFSQKTTYETLQDIRYAGIPLQFVGDDPVAAKSKAVFAQANWEIVQGLNLSGGLRYTNETKDYTFSRKNPDGGVNFLLGALNGTVGSYKGNRVDYRVNVDYRLSEALLVYGNVATGFKGGGINPRPFNVAQVRPFGAETLTNYEVGFKSDLLDRKLRLNVSAFYSDYKNIQIPLLSCPQFGGPGPCALPANAGDGHFKGVEAEAFLHPLAGLTIDASASYLHFNFVKGSINPAAGGPTNPAGAQEGDPSGQAPKWKWSLGAQYEFPLSDTLGTLTPRVDAAYQARIFQGHAPALVAGTVGPREFLGGYTLVNARLTYANPAKDFTVSLEGTNLGNKYYFLTQFDGRGAGAGFYKKQPGRPREWAVTVKKKF